MHLSLLLPLYNTESTLLNCLNSVLSQDWEGLNFKNNLELVLVNDASTSRDSDGKTSKQIIKQFKKSVRKAHKKIKIIYIEHYQNKGLVEARRTALYASSGKYVMILDTDDTLPPNALSSLYTTGVQQDADIVHGRTNVNATTPSLAEKILKKANLIYTQNGGILLGPQILDAMLVHHSINSFLWGKLYKRELYLNAFEYIPPVYNTFAEDYLQSLWLYFCAKKYVSLPDTVYNYNYQTGISSHKKITDLDTWQKVCSTASVFTSIFSTIDTLPQGTFTPAQEDSIKTMCRTYLKNNLTQLNNAVLPDLRPQAYALLCDYWGTDFVEEIQNDLSL